MLLKKSFITTLIDRWQFMWPLFRLARDSKLLGNFRRARVMKSGKKLYLKVQLKENIRQNKNKNNRKFVVMKYKNKIFR